MLNILWQLSNAIGQIFTVVNGQILKNKSSHLVTLSCSHFAFVSLTWFKRFVILIFLKFTIFAQQI